MVIVDIVWLLGKRAVGFRPGLFKIFIGNPWRGAGAALRENVRWFEAFLLSPPKEGSKKGAAGFEAAAARLGGCTPPRPPKRRSKPIFPKNEHSTFS